MKSKGVLLCVCRSSALRLARNYDDVTSYVVQRIFNTNLNILVLLSRSILMIGAEIYYNLLAIQRLLAILDRLAVQ